MFAFVSGGIVCIIGKLFAEGFIMLGTDKAEAYGLSSYALIVIAGFLTGIGIFDKMASYCGAGLLVPITGFSNAVTSPAVDAKTEGFVLGVGADIFKIAGSVIVFGNLTAVVYGVIYYLVKVI